MALKASVLVLLLQGVILLKYGLCSDTLCDSCYTTRMNLFDNLLIKDYVMWNRNVMDKVGCYRLCHTDSACVTFQFNTDTQACRGMAASFTSPSGTETLLETGNRLFVPCTAGHRFGAACTFESDCLATNTECRDGRCLCEEGFEFWQTRCVHSGIYVGCYQDRSDRMFPGGVSNNSMTKEFCVDYCIRNGHVYSALQNRNFCACGDALPENYEKKEDSACSLQCGGDANQLA